MVIDLEIVFKGVALGMGAGCTGWFIRLLVSGIYNILYNPF